MSASRWIPWLGLLLLLAIRPARAGEAEWLAELERIEAMQDQAAAHAALAALEPRLPDERSVALSRRLLAVRFELHRDSDPVAAGNDADAMLTLAREQQLPALRLEGLLNKATVLADAGRNREGLELVREALADLDRSGDPDVRFLAHNVAGTLFSNVSDFEQALSHYLQALPLATATGAGHDARELLVLNNIGSLYLNQRQPDAALGHIERGIALATAAGNQRMLATLQLNRGYALASLNRHDEAVVAYQRGLALARETGNEATEIVALINLSDHELNQKNWPAADAYSRQALVLAQRRNDATNTAIARANIGIALAGRGLLRQGLQELHAAREMFEHSGNLAIEDLALVEIARITEQAGLTADTISALRRQLALREKIFATDRQRAVTELQEQFEASSRQRQIELLETENQLQAAALDKHRLQRWLGGLITLTVILAATVAVMSYRRVREVNRRLKEANTQLEDQSIRDPLTGLLNRRSFQREMDRRWQEQDRRQTATPTVDGLLLLDIDHFKRINDSYGHATGDAVLVDVARRLSQEMRDRDKVLRWGGEEFLLLVRASNLAALTQVCQRILDTLATNPVQYQDKSIAITASTGFVPLPFAGLPETVFGWERALQLADLALYLGKVRGRNRGYGVLNLHGNYAEVAPMLEQNLAQAIRNGVVEVVEVLGPGANPTGSSA